jgi:predicted PhzF superfamily epimerase YddE/YHI9
MVRLPTLSDLGRLTLDNVGLVNLSRRLGVDTIGVWALHPSGASAQVRLRDLCHGVGNAEEAASGTTNGALACWLARLGLLIPTPLGTARLDAEQGVEMGRPSRLETQLTFDADRTVTDVRVAGKASRFLDGHVSI